MGFITKGVVMDKKLIEDAYRKLKGSVYWDKTLPFLRMRIAEYEENEIDKKLSALYLAIQDENRWKNLQSQILSSIDVLTFPKKIRNKNEINDTELNGAIVISNVNGEDIEIKKYNNFIDMSVEGHILGMLWILKIGYKMDQDLGNASNTCCYGNRLNDNLIFNDKGTTASPSLFKPYFEQYESWRNKGLNLAREKSGEKSLIITMLDLTRYYYNIEITEKSYKDMTAKYCQDMKEKDINDRLNKFVYNVCVTYSNKCGYISSNMLPIGFHPSNIIANYYLKDIDSAMQKVPEKLYYGRYVDDMFLLTEIEDEDSNAFRQEVMNNGNSHVVDYMVNKLEKADILVKNGNEEFSLKGYKKLKFQKQKFRFFYIDKDGYDLIIDRIYEDICKNTSEFNYVPEDVIEEFNTNILDIERDDSVNKLRAINKATIDKYAISKTLGKNILMSKFTDEKEVEKFVKSLEQVLDYKETLNNYTLWENILNYYVINNHMKGIVHLSKTVLEAIEHMDEDTNKIEEYQYLQRQSIKRVEDSLRYYYFACLTRSTAVFGGKPMEDKLRKISEIFLNALKNKQEDVSYDFDSIKKYRDLYRKSRMINKKILPISVGNYMEEIQPNLSTEDKFGKFSLNQYLENGLKNPYIKNNKKYTPYIITPFEILYGELIRQIRNGSRRLHSDRECLEILYSKYAENFGTIKWEGLKKYISELCYKNGHSIIRVESDYEEEINIAVANVKMKDNDIEDILKQKTRNVSDRCNEIGRILNEAIRCHADILVFPEAYIPLEYLEILQRKVAKHNMVVIGGIEHIRHEQLVYNITTTILPIKVKNTSYAVPFFHEKQYFSPGELEGLEREECEPVKGQEHSLFQWKGINFVTYCCYELTSMKLRQTFQGKADIVFGVEWNRDIHYFGNIIHALSREMYCYCVQSNMSKYGDSRIVQPTSEVCSNIIRVKGGDNAAVLVGKVNIEKLRKNRVERNKEEKFKPLPAGWYELDKWD